MNNPDWTHYLALCLSVACTVSGQLAFKYGALRKMQLHRAMLEPVTFVGYGLMGLVTILAVYSFQELPLTFTTAYATLIYVLVVILASVFFNEKVSKRQWLGSLLVCAGVLIFSI